MANKHIPVVVLGGSGYVAGELTRLLVQHPHFDLAAIVSTSAAGEPVAKTFPHLAPALGQRAFESNAAAMELLKKKRTLGVFSALPHGDAASLLGEWMDAAHASGCELRVVDLSSDFRFRDAAQYANIYGKEHPRPDLLDQFFCALPDVLTTTPGQAVSHPGCFTTSVTLALSPLFASGWFAPEVVVSSVTGSTGSGRQPKPGTHHPERHGGLWAYEPLRHRHQPEMQFLVKDATGVTPQIAFVPHSGPFSRGIHSSLVLRLAKEVSEVEIREQLVCAYAHSSFVSVRETWPSIKDVVGTNMCHLAVRKEGDTVFVASVIDNLTKGAAGGGVQWMNRLFAYDDDCGLLLPGLGWS